jgi:DNA mismatch repair protein MSH2
LFSNVEISASPIALSVKLGIRGDQRMVGVSFADTTIRELGVSEFIDNELFSNFEVYHIILMKHNSFFLFIF